jgi:hypothetical protein
VPKEYSVCDWWLTDNGHGCCSRPTSFVWCNCMLSVVMILLSDENMDQTITSHTIKSLLLATISFHATHFGANWYRIMVWFSYIRPLRYQRSLFVERQPILFQSLKDQETLKKIPEREPAKVDISWPPCQNRWQPKSYSLVLHAILHRLNVTDCVVDLLYLGLLRYLRLAERGRINSITISSNLREKIRKNMVNVLYLQEF